MSLLVAIRQSHGSGVRELAAREGVSPAAMSRQVSRLVSSGLVRRVEGPGGDRAVALELTEEADRVLRLVRSRRTAWLARPAPELDDGQLAVDRGRCSTPLRALLARAMTRAFVRLNRRTFASLRYRNYRLFFSAARSSRSPARGCRTSRWRGSCSSLTGSPVAVGMLALCQFLPFSVFGLFSRCRSPTGSTRGGS